MIQAISIWVSSDSSPRPQLVAAAEDEFGNRIRHPSRGFTPRHAKTEKTFHVHCPASLQLAILERERPLEWK